MKTLIAIPCVDLVHEPFMDSMTKLRKLPDTSYTIVKNTLIHDSRNIIARNAIEAGFDRIMWFDSDMRFDPDTLERLSADMDAGLEFVTGLYFTRRKNCKPVIYKTLWWNNEGDELDAGAENYFDYPENKLFEIAGAGFGCCLTSVDLIKRVGDKFGSPFNPLASVGEDLSFCLRAMKVGAKLWCDSSVKCGHIGYFEYNEEAYRNKV